MSVFKGAAVAIITPMFDNGEVNYPKLGEMIEFQIANKTDAIVICGTTGESSTISREERTKIIKFSTCIIEKRVPLIIGTGSNSTKTAIELSKENKRTSGSRRFKNSISA